MVGYVAKKELGEDKEFTYTYVGYLDTVLKSSGGQFARGCKVII